ncbi:hypothetical protein J6590_083549 [Homalodisca vitripennis]|nr:hypothetical protein J6590_083549 [Homalodisca vitripennis]
MRLQTPFHVCLRASRREQLIRAPVTAGTFQTRIKIDYRFPSAIQTPPEGKHIFNETLVEPFSCMALFLVNKKMTHILHDLKPKKQTNDHVV